MVAQVVVAVRDKHVEVCSAEQLFEISLDHVSVPKLFHGTGDVREL